MGRVRITRPFVLLALAVLLSPPAEASRTSVWERNPPASLTATRADEAGLLASLAPIDVADVDATGLPHFDLGDIALVERELEPVLALPVRRHESEDRPGELAPRIVALAFAFDGNALDRAGLAPRIAERAQRGGLVARDAALEPREAPPRRELGVDVLRLERKRAGEARRRIPKERLLRVWLVDPAQQLDHVDAGARDLDAHGERGPVAIGDRAALRLDVQASLTLTLGGLAPRRPIFDLHPIRRGDERTEAEPHDPAEQAHAHADPLGACRVEVPHGASPSGTTRSGGGGSMPSSVVATISTRSGVL